MEQRICPRIPVCIDVLAYQHGLPVLLGRTRNISRGGMFLEIDAAGFAPGEVLQIEFCGPGTLNLPRRVDANVAFIGEQGAGLSLACGEDLATAIFAELMRMSNPFPAARVGLN